MIRTGVITWHALECTFDDEDGNRLSISLSDFMKLGNVERRERDAVAVRLTVDNRDRITLIEPVDQGDTRRVDKVAQPKVSRPGDRPSRTRPAPVAAPSEIQPVESADPPTPQATPAADAAAETQPVVEPPPGFHNPYNFIPAPARSAIGGELGDQHADTLPGLGCLEPDRWTGTLDVSLTVKTPLLLLDPSSATEEAGHSTYPVTVDADGQPLLRASSVRGMLRSAYEAITNSRFGVSSEANRRHLGYRLEARSALGLVPVVVTDDGAELLPGTRALGGEPGQPPLMYAAHLPSYAQGAVRPLACDRWSPEVRREHGELVDIVIEEVNYQARFRYWNVVEVRPATSTAPTDVRTDDGQNVATGYLVITGRSFGRKKWERVFFGAPVKAKADLADMSRQWQELIFDYRAQHLDKDQQPGTPVTGAPGGGAVVFGRHLTAAGVETLLPGPTLAYARVDPAAGGWEITGLFPAMVSRNLFEQTPESLLVDAGLLPAADPNQLSPADRVFGWASQNGSGAWASRLLVGPVKNVGDVPQVAEFDDPLPLAVLSSPKPKQAGFYFARDDVGTPLDPVRSRATTAGQVEGIRGRKVYPHNRNLPDGYWDPNSPAGDNIGGRFREFRRPVAPGGTDADGQNRSIAGWVQPGARFTFQLRVTNLSDVEMGALLWLLQLGEGAFHKLGYGKPLGFGSVCLKVDAKDVVRGTAWSGRFTDFFGGTGESKDDDPASTVESFKSAVVEAYGGEFDNVSFIRAFLAAVEGFTGPVHYPRATQLGGASPPPPNPAGRNFEWFVANQRLHSPHALPSVDAGEALPYLDL